MRLDIAPMWVENGRAHSWYVVDLDNIWLYEKGKVIVQPISGPFEHASEAFNEKGILAASGISFASRPFAVRDKSQDQALQKERPSILKGIAKLRSLLPF